MASRQIGKGHIFGLATLAFGIADVSGYISANTKSLRLVHNADVERIKSTAGLTAAIIGNDEILECTFDFIPNGASLAQAISSGGLPKVPSPVTITGAQIIAIGPFTDAINTNGASTQPWIYEGGGTLTGPDSAIWTSTFTLRRYTGITSGTVIT